MRNLSAHIARMLLTLRELPAGAAWARYEGPRLSVNAITSRAGSLYEKLRYTVDYQDENAIRRSAIERGLRRFGLIVQEGAQARELLKDLIQSGYIDNEVLPEEVIPDVQAIIDRYDALRSAGLRNTKALTSFAALEIERYLFPVFGREQVFEAAYRSVLEYVKPKPHEHTSEASFKLYTYVACRRALLKDSPEALAFALWTLLEPEWSAVSEMNRDTLVSIAERFDGHQEHIKRMVRSPIPSRIESRLHNEAIYAALMLDMVRTYGHDAQALFGERERLAERVRAMAEHAYPELRKKISRSGTQSILYILITKVVIGLAIELPYELYVLNHVNMLSLVINMAFFPMLLMLMVKTIRMPGPRNTEALIAGFERFVTGERPRPVYVRTETLSTFSFTGFGLFYLILCIITFGGILSILAALSFNMASMALFLFFLVVVSYFGLRIRYRARAWTYDTGADSSLGVLSYLLFLPVTRTGRWISTRLSSVNIFVMFMDFVLETPFKLLLGSFDEFVSFSKEMRRDG